MNRRLSSCLASLLLAGWLAAGCGDEQAPSNTLPTLVGPIARSTDVIAGTPVTIELEASDPDGESLTYAWTQTPSTPAGSFSDASAASPTWTAPQVAQSTLFQLSVSVTDSQGGTARGSVRVLVRPAPPANLPPTFTQAPRASPASVTGAVPVQLSLTATDPDQDSLTYTWSQEPATPVGSFSSSFAANPTWISPEVSSPQTFTLKVTVSDGKGGTVQGQVTVDVAPPSSTNRAPVLTGPSASTTTVNEQQSITLSASATDPDGDPITYTWAQTAPASPVGSFSSTTAANPTWTAPDVTANGTYTLRVTASDGQGGNATGTLDITVNKVNQAPTVAASISGPTTLVAGDTGTFSITASDPDGDPLTYSWTQTAPATQGSWVGSTTDSSAQWYSPAISAETSFTLSVSVTDGQSPAVVRTLTLPVAVPTYSAVQSVWTGTCTGCHGTSGELDLAEGASHGNLVGVAANACGPTLRVAPSDPDNSALIQKMTGTTCGTRMPRNNQTYFDNNPGLVVRVRSWILAGANP
jgi:hypothetical protein